MYIDKEDAIKLADNARKAIEKLSNLNRKGGKVINKETHHIILDLEYQLDNLEKAIEECPTLIRKENGELV